MKKNLKDKPLITLTEINIGNSVESFSKFLDSQKDLLHSQVDQLQNLVVEQCRLTGVNPLSQEMAAGALSINIGKRPRDLLNPKGVKYMQSVFSIKDTIGKKETREISALCGVTATQVREFFAGQRSRVKKLVRLSREKAIKAGEERTSQGGCSTSSDPAKPVTDPAPSTSVDPNAIKSDAEKTLEGECFTNSDPAMHVINPTPLNSVDPQCVEEASSCLSKDEPVPGADDFEKKFIENIYALMRKEEKFSGQVKLMEWILQIQNTSVLYWFVTKGGLMMLAAWLNEAALEEQTTVLLVIFQVLCHLPLHKALPLQMSAILQTVNRLRFYRTSDISNRAKVLLSRWSRLFVRSQALRKPASTFNSQKEKHLSRCDDWQSNLGLPEEIFSLAIDSSENCRKVESSPTLKLLQASSDDSNKKNIRNVSSTQTKERRKVQLMEQPNRNTNGRNPQVTRAMHSNHGRPMSADDIQKAKMRAAFMQCKNGKTGAASNDSQKTQELRKSFTSQISPSPSPSKPLSRHKIEESETPLVLNSETKPLLLSSEAKPLVLFSETKPLVPPLETSPTQPEPPLDIKPSLPPEESPLEKLKRDQIPWHLPPEIRMDSQWSVGVGENSKEVEIQTGRIKREKETVYNRIQDIPFNPKEPWDLEMDYDDSLTLQIPIEQVPEEFSTAEAPQAAVIMEAPVPPVHVESTSVAPVPVPPPPPPSPPPAAPPAAAPVVNGDNVPEPDLELLAVLLKNPELVFALTSGQGGNLSTAETVKLLDMIKNTGGGITGVLNNGFIQKEQASFPSPTPTPTPTPTPHSFPSPTPHALPSPTPHSEHHVMNEWRPEASNHSFPQSVSMNDGEEYAAFPPAARSRSPSIGVSTTGLLQHQCHTNSFAPGLAQLQTQTQTTKFMDNFPSGRNHHYSIPDTHFSQMNHQNSNHQNIMAAAGYPTLQPEPMSYGQSPLQPEPVNYGQMLTVKPAPVSIVLNYADGTPITLPPLMPTQQSSLLPEQRPYQHPQTMMMQWNAVSSSRHNQMSDTRGERYNAPGSYHWPQSNQNNYNSFHEDVQPLMYPPTTITTATERSSSWDEPEYETYSPGRIPERSRSRSPEYRSGRNNNYTTEGRRDHGRNPRSDWSRRRDSGRRDYNKPGNRRWRDRR